MDGNLIVVPIMGVASILIHVIRLAGRLYFKIRLDVSDLLAALAILILAVFIGVVPVVMQWGTSNITTALRNTLEPGSGSCASRDRKQAVNY